MSNPLTRVYQFFQLDPCQKYGSNESFFRGLAARETAAIQCLMLKTRASVAFLVKKTGLDETYTDDVLHESVVIFLRKIEDGNYRFEGNSPATYLIEIARWVALNFSRKPSLRPFDGLAGEHAEIRDPQTDEHLTNRENAEYLERLLETLENPCRDIINLHYLEGFSDEEVVNGRMVNISTVGSLKARRSQCMKKLREMANSGVLSF